MLKIVRATGLILLLTQLPVHSQLTDIFAFTDLTKRYLNENTDSNLLLLLAAEQGNTDSVRILIEKGYDINQTSAEGVSALMYAANNGFLETVKLLVGNDAKIDMKPQNGITALAGAVINNHYDVVLYLLQHGADVEIKDEWGLTPLMYASSYDFLEVTELLLMFGADPEQTDMEGATALHATTIYAQPDIAWLLLDYGADINRQDDFGFTPLMMAVQLGRTEMVGYLLDNNARISIETEDGLSTLAIAIANDQPEIAAELIALGADPAKKISATDNLMNLAKWKENEKLILLMEQHNVRANIIPDFRTLRISAGGIISRGDFFNGIDAALSDNKYNLVISAGWYTRPVRRAVLVRFDDKWYDQLWEQRNLFYGGVSFKFPVTNIFGIDERGFYTGLKTVYSKGKYWGTYRYPANDWHIVPAIGYYYESYRWFFNFGYEYLQLNITEKSAHRLAFGFGIRFQVKKDPLIYRTTYW